MQAALVAVLAAGHTAPVADGSKASIRDKWSSRWILLQSMASIQLVERGQRTTSKAVHPHVTSAEQLLP